jgi:hypothetical protein
MDEILILIDHSEMKQIITLEEPQAGLKNTSLGMRGLTDMACVGCGSNNKMSITENSVHG